MTALLFVYWPVFIYDLSLNNAGIRKGEMDWGGSERVHHGQWWNTLLDWVDVLKSGIIGIGGGKLLDPGWIWVEGRCSRNGTNQPFVCRQTGSQKVQYLDSPKVQYQNLGILYQYSQILSKSTISDAPQDDTSPTSLIVRRGNEAQHNCTRYSTDSVPGRVCTPSWIEIRVWMRLILLLTDGHQVPIHHPCDNCSAKPDLCFPLRRMWTIGQGTHCFRYT